MMKQHNPAYTHFLYFFLYNLCFFALQLTLVYSQAGNFMTAAILPFTVYGELIGTLAIHIGLYLFVSVIQTAMLLGITRRTWHYFSDEQWQLIIWVVSITALLSANIYFFPLSIFSKMLAPPLPYSLAKLIMYLSIAGLSFFFMNWLFSRSSLRLIIIFSPIISLIFICSHYAPKWGLFKTDATSQITAHPNLIILGIDSLSPESVTQKSMPFLWSLLQNGIQFTNAISPLARTYPAWSSILTGLYAEHHHAEENLVAKKNVASKHSMVWLLNKQGYYSVYATDDRRFNSIGTEFGFNKIIGPKLGVNDVLLGSFNDFPLSNLIINSPLGAWLFPYNYMNRASFFSYYPKTFNSELNNKLLYNTQQPPIFLAVHFTLPHWPYAWAGSLPEEVNNEFSLEKREVLYQKALKRVDQQFKSFYSLLMKKGFFKNCLLIVLSDHGEALYYPNSRLTNHQNYKGTLPSKLAEYFKTQTATELDKSAGHGSDILSPKQYHSIVGFYIYNHGVNKTPHTKINTRIALIDLAPTILDYARIRNQQKMDGISLLNTIQNPNQLPPERSFFVESGMFPNQEISKTKALAIGKRFYQVNPNTDEIEIKANKLDYFNQQKLYGIISGSWIFALYPNNRKYIPVIQNLVTGEWSDEMNSQFALSSPAKALHSQLKLFYGKKLDESDTQPQISLK